MDHSKWSIASVDSSKPRPNYKQQHLVCIGDLNHMYSQRHRGGGTLCFESHNRAIWENLHNSVNEVEPCSIARPLLPDIL